MIVKEVILEDSALERLFGSSYLYYDLSESIDVWSHAFFCSLHDATKGDYSNQFPFSVQ